MAAKEMYDYLSTISADVDVTLSLTPNMDLIEDGNIPDVEIHYGDDGSEERVLIGSGASVFTLTLSFINDTEADIGTVIDIYHNSVSGKLYTFKFDHPDGHTYVVRFESTLPRTISVPYLHSIKSIKLAVLGRIAD